MAHDILTDKAAAYLAGKFSPQESRQFEAEMAADPALAEEVELQRLEAMAMDELFRQDLEAKIPGWLDSLDNVPEPPSTPVPPVVKTRFSLDGRHWSLGAVAFLSLSLAFWLWANWKAVNQRASDLEKQLQTEQAEKTAIQRELNLLQEDFKTLQNASQQQTPKTQPEKPSAPKPNAGAIPSSKPQASVELPKLAEDNLEGLYASVDEVLNKGFGATKGTAGGSEAALKLFEAGRAEFSKKGRNAAVVKNNLTQIPASETGLYPFSQAMLAEVYFREKNYRRAVDSYARFAESDNSIGVQWRLLNLRLAAYPYQKAEFWALLRSFSGTEDLSYKGKVEVLHKKLRERGITE